MTVEDGVARLSIRGHLTAEESHEYFHQGPGVRIVEDAACILVDYSDARIDREWVPLLPQEGVHPAAVCMKPGALVVPEAKVDIYKELAWQMALRGVVRGIFSDGNLARSWIKARRQFFSEQALQTQSSAQAWRAPACAAADQ